MTALLVRVTPELTYDRAHGKRGTHGGGTRGTSPANPGAVTATASALAARPRDGPTGSTPRCHAARTSGTAVLLSYLPAIGNVGQNCSPHELMYPVSAAALSLTRRVHVPFATSAEALTVYVVLMLSVEPPVPYAFSV